jgi:hypothetical protein
MLRVFTHTDLLVQQCVDWFQLDCQSCQDLWPHYRKAWRYTPKKFKERVPISRGFPWLDHDAGWISAQIEMNARGCIIKTQPTHSRRKILFVQVELGPRSGERKIISTLVCRAQPCNPICKRHWWHELSHIFFATWCPFANSRPEWSTLPGPGISFALHKVCNAFLHLLLVWPALLYPASGMLFWPFLFVHVEMWDVFAQSRQLFRLQETKCECRAFLASCSGSWVAWLQSIVRIPHILNYALCCSGHFVCACRNLGCFCEFCRYSLGCETAARKESDCIFQGPMLLQQGLS